LEARSDDDLIVYDPSADLAEPGIGLRSVLRSDAS
jgi:hypothetical protein